MLMARSDRLFKATYNRSLDHLASGGEIRSLSGLSRTLGVSRTTTRKIIAHLALNGLIGGSPNATGALETRTSDWQPLRAPRAGDYYLEHQTRPTGEEIESNFMNWILHERVLPGTKISEAELARRFGVSASTVREFLIRLSRFGFIRKEPHRHWVLDGFSPDYASELLEFRRVFELRALARVADLPADSPFWSELEASKQQHLDLSEILENNFLQMPAVDVQFHSLLGKASGSRLLPALGDAVSLIFHYHYHHFWDEESRYRRARSAIADHLKIIDALQQSDRELALTLMDVHLNNARKALEDTIN